ncbi:uncharacterized protein LOC123653902 [Melitaea cinxia]|uniref:uncharacterized protein LOC123653902 n=1 Tax=Melitaea cinxia TaxID=113334 RepID=UPI001E273AD6|nr:uncharacterized protein LOC123653902 [Melitaea cinxia]
MILTILKRLPLQGKTLLMPKIRPTQIVRQSGELLPPTQYDVPIPRKLHLTYVLRTYWEIIPLFLVTCTSLSFMFFSIAWAFKNKVDVTYTSRSRECISRTMNLRNPSVHKLFIINQRYEPWPEMQDVLDKMVMAEKRALVRLQTCAQ